MATLVCASRTLTAILWTSSPRVAHWPSRHSRPDRVVKSTRQMPPPAKKEVDGPRVEIIGLTTTIGAACCGVFHGQPLVGSERRRRYIKEKDSTMPRLVLLYDAEQSRWTLVAEEGTAGDVIGVIAYQATDSPSPVSDRDSSWFERVRPCPPRPGSGLDLVGCPAVRSPPPPLPLPQPPTLAGATASVQAEEGDAFVEARECACLAADKVSGDRLSISFNDVMDQIDGEDVTQALPPRPKSPRAPSDKEIGGLVCYNSHGEKVHAFIGIIDILQNFGYKKKAEHTYKSLRWDGNTVSVHNPTFYSQRFQRFLGATVFRPDATSSKPAASDRKPASAARGRSFMRRVNANEASRSPTRRGATAVRQHPFELLWRGDPLLPCRASSRCFPRCCHYKRHREPGCSQRLLGTLILVCCGRPRRVKAQKPGGECKTPHRGRPSCRPGSSLSSRSTPSTVALPRCHRYSSLPNHRTRCHKEAFRKRVFSVSQQASRPCRFRGEMRAMQCLPRLSLTAPTLGCRRSLPSPTPTATRTHASTHTSTLASTRGSYSCLPPVGWVWLAKLAHAQVAHPFDPSPPQPQSSGSMVQHPRHPQR